MKLQVEQRLDLAGRPWQFTIVEWDRTFIRSEWPTIAELEHCIEIHRRARERGIQVLVTQVLVTWD